MNDKVNLVYGAPTSRHALPATSHWSLVTGHAFVLALALGLAGCDYLPFGYTPIKDILAAPANFEGKEVKLKGKVTDAIKLPILGQAFTLQDESGRIEVVTQGPLPPVSADIALKGTVKSAAIIGGQSLGLRVEETQRLR